MSGFCGIWHRDGRPVDGDLLARMSSAIAHRGPDGEGMRLAGPLGLAHRLLRITPESESEVQPLSDGAGRILVWDGRLDERVRFRYRLGERTARYRHPSDRPPSGNQEALPTADAPDPDLVLAWLSSSPDPGLDRIEGEWALALFEPSLPRLLLARDPIGTRPLYWTVRGDLVVFGTEIKALLAHPEVIARPDEEYLAVRLVGSNREGTGDRTFYAGIRMVLPGHLLDIAPAEVRSVRFWDFGVDRPLPPAATAEYAEALRGHLERAVDRRLRSRHPVAVSVSGGLDSSSIYGVALALGRSRSGGPPLLGFSYQPPAGSPADEGMYVDALARHWGEPIERLPVVREGPMAYSRDVVRAVEAPFLDEFAATMTVFQQRIRASGVRVLLSGHWADQFLFDQAYLVDLVRRGRLGLVRRHLREYPRWFPDADAGSFRSRLATDLLKYLLPASLVRRLRAGRLRPESFGCSDRLRDLARRSPLNRALPIPRWGPIHSRALYEQARSAHHVLCLEWDVKAAAVHGLEVAFPFFDRDVVDFLIRVPGEALHREGVPKGLLREAMTPYLPPLIRDRDWKADFSFLVNEGVGQDLAEMAALLDAGAWSERFGFVRESSILEERARIVQGLAGADCLTAWSLLDLVGLELWLREFFLNT